MLLSVGLGPDGGGGGTNFGGPLSLRGLGGGRSLISTAIVLPSTDNDTLLSDPDGDVGFKIFGASAKVTLLCLFGIGGVMSLSAVSLTRLGFGIGL